MTLNFGQSLFPRRGEIQATYDFFDITNLTGYQTFYAAVVNGSSDEFIFTTDNTFKSDRTHKTTGFVPVNGVDTKAIELDLDLEFLVPQNIKGDIYLNVPAGFKDSVGKNGVTFIIVSMFHFDGSTETQIGSTVQSADHDHNATQSASVFGLKVNAASSVHFAAGEKLRITVEMWMNVSTADPISHAGFGLDPADRDDFARESTDDTIFVAGETTRLSAHIPFKIEAT